MRDRREAGFFDRVADGMERALQRPISRREVLGAGAALGASAIGAAALGLRQWSSGLPEPSDVAGDPASLPPLQELSPAWKGPEMFFDTNANEVARSYGINAGTFFITPKETLDKLDAFLDNDLYPVYPAAVMAQADLIYRLSDKFSVPPNIIATIMSIESAGNVGIPSNMNAQGLFQVMPDKFPYEIRSNPAKMIDPDINGKYGMGYFMEFCLPTSQEALVPLGYSPDHPVVYARALMGYNGGPGTIPLSFQSSNLYDETRFYGDHFIRYPLILQIAKGLREKGYADGQIVKALTLNSAIELDARASALQDFDQRERAVGGYEYWQYRAVSRLLARENPDDERGIEEIPMPDLESLSNKEDREEQIRREKQYMKDVFSRIKSSYVEYKTKPHYGLPLSAALRMWVNLGGLALLQNAPANMSPDAYYNTETKRKH